jgi:Asp-tRNA(Asn)/Glu-tRNA(Gln) amidotransferase A subunit family amidase
MAVTVAQAERGLCATGAPPLPMVELTIAQARAALLGGFLNCSALVLAHIQRIAAYNQPTQLNAVRAVHPGVLAAAAALDAQLAAARAGGAPLPPLFCVPLLIKDNVDVVGLATTAGVAALLDNFPAARSAWAVARLQAAGAVVLGKSNMGDFAFFPASCVSSAGGTVRNPYHLHRSPAGSSGGSAAGVAASLAVGALGTDTGNSIRGPASHTALVGLRPSLGLVGRSGIVPLRLDRDTVGPLARSVADAAALLEVMAGADPGDNATVSAVGII